MQLLHLPEEDLPNIDSRVKLSESAESYLNEAKIQQFAWTKSITKLRPIKEIVCDVKKEELADSAKNMLCYVMLRTLLPNKGGFKPYMGAPEGIFQNPTHDGFTIIGSNIPSPFISFNERSK